MDKSKENQEEKKLELILAKVRMAKYSAFLSIIVLFLAIFSPNSLNFFKKQPKMAANLPASVENAEEEVANGIHLATGLKFDIGYDVVAAQCGACHSLKLVTQNKATKEGWEGIIDWMQETQNLWDLGAKEDTILAYLAKNYAPENTGRRKQLQKVEWYELED